MFNQFQKLAFTAGEQAPRLRGRSDLENYDFGLELSENWVVDFLGAVFTRPGTEFLDYVQDEGETGRLVPFRFNADLGNTYILVFTKDRLRFVQDGAYVLEAAVTLSSFVGDLFTTSAPHGFSVGDMLKIAGKTAIIATVPNADEFTCADIFGVTYNSTMFSPTEVQRVYTLASPYATADLNELVFDKNLDTLYITHRNYAPRKLIRAGSTSWSLNTDYASGFSAGPASITLTPSAGASAGVVFAVTAVNAEGVEAPLTAGGIARNLATVNWTATAGYMRVTWAAVTGAVKYRVYRSLVYTRAESATFGVDLGFIGETQGLEFTDGNIIPDFTQYPLTVSNLLRPGGLETVTVTAGGTGYTSDPTVTVGGGGSGAEVLAIREGSVITGLMILNAGTGYTNPTISISGGGGSGATATATASPIATSYPAATALVQQRRFYGGLLRAPSLIFASRPGDYDNFAASGLNLDNDPLSYLLAQIEETPIRQLIKANVGMFAFMQNEVQIIRGIDDNIILPSGIRADDQNESGSGFLPVLRIGRDYLYASQSSESAYALIPSNLPNYYETKNLTFYSNHLFVSTNKITSWTWAEDPHQLIWATREDGTLLSGTYMREQNVMGWVRHSTQGFFESVAGVLENDLDRTYALAQRELRDQTVRTLERVAIRDTLSVEDMWAVDCGLESTLVKPAATLTLSGASGTVTATASASVFSPGDVGKMLRVRDGRGLVTAYTSGTEVTANFGTPITLALNQTRPTAQAAGTWSLTEEFTTFGGLDHLEGKEVEILADGSAIPNQTVTNGEITLVQPASNVRVGLPYEAEFTTLPITASDAILDGNLKQVIGVGIRLHDTRGLAVGETPDIYEVLFEPNSVYTEPVQYKTGYVRQSVRTSLDGEGKITVKKVGPQHASVLGLVMETSLERSP